MITKLTNKNPNFYNYMGKFFGSRIVQVETNDRIYDDDNKDWYVFLKDDSVVAFVALCKNVIKNVYSVRDDYLAQLLNTITAKIAIDDSVVTKRYLDVYESCNFKIFKLDSYKNFIMIRCDKCE